MVFEEINFPNVRVGEAGVSAATPLTQQSVFVVEDKNDTGVAFANIGTAAASITFQLFDTSGVAFSTVTRTLAAKNHTAFFVSQLFSGLPKKFYGTMRITSNTPLVATALLFEETGQFATLPIIPPPQ